MEKISLSPWPEIVFGSSDSAVSQSIRRAVAEGKLRKLAPRIYTSNLKDSPAKILERNCYFILGVQYPGAVISHRSALEGGVSRDGHIVLTYKYTKNIELPGLNIRLLKGEGAQLGDTPFMGNLFLASRERALLENLQASRGPFPKTLSREAIENYLDRVAQIHGVEELNRIRDKAKKIATALGAEPELKILENLIGTLLGTRKSKISSKAAKARSLGAPYDSNRLNLFATLHAKLANEIIRVLPIQITNEEWLKNLAFFEAYFSNYIEGTEFKVEEAIDIIFHNKIIKNRSADSHDVLGTYKIVSNADEMHTVPKTFEELVYLLKSRHALLMSARTDKNPGEFKEVFNRAGNTILVAPELVMGTLKKAFEIYRELEPGIKSAIFMMFMISETHPFVDGNGRVARIMMNAELTRANQSRIIIPTVYREDYILALKRFSSAGDPDPYCNMLQRAQAFTASINFSEYEIAHNYLIKCEAFLEPRDGKLQF